MPKEYRGHYIWKITRLMVLAFCQIMGIIVENIIHSSHLQVFKIMHRDVVISFLDLIFGSDISAGDLSQFMFYTPNMQNDGHDSSLEFAGSFATKFFNQYLTLFPNRTLIVVTFDEADQLGGPDYTGNHIQTYLLGDMVVPGSVDWNHFSHPSITRLVEENWGLGSLGRGDATASIMFPQPDVPNMRDSLDGGSVLGAVVVLVLVVVFL